MRRTTKALVLHYIDQLKLAGDVLEVGGHRLAMSAINLFPSPQFRYRDMNIECSDIPQTIIGDITDCKNEVLDESFDVVFSSDVLEHITRPWLAAKEISRILRPSGIAIIVTLFSWRNHPCPLDYWRFSPECLEFLFSDLICLEKGYDLSERRNDQPGFWLSGMDSVPIDSLGGWREHWAVYCVVGKDVDREFTRFRDSEHPEAKYLRMDTQGRITNPRLLERN